MLVEFIDADNDGAIVRIEGEAEKVSHWRAWHLGLLTLKKALRAMNYSRTRTMCGYYHTILCRWMGITGDRYFSGDEIKRFNVLYREKHGDYISRVAKRDMYRNEASEFSWDGTFFREPKRYVDWDAELKRAKEDKAQFIEVSGRCGRNGCIRMRKANEYWCLSCSWSFDKWWRKKNSLHEEKRLADDAKEAQLKVIRLLKEIT